MLDVAGAGALLPVLCLSTTGGLVFVVAAGALIPVGAWRWPVDGATSGFAGVGCVGMVGPVPGGCVVGLVGATMLGAAPIF